MIIVMNESKLNKHCANEIAKCYGIASSEIYYYPLHFFSKSDHIVTEPLFIIDLDADNHFQDTIDSALFAMRLNVRNVTSDVNDIYLLVSDVHVQKRLPIFAHSLANKLTKIENRKIGVHIPTSLTYDITFVVPPVNEGQWLVYGIYRDDLSNNKKNLNLNQLKNEKNKKLLWEGKNILQWLTLSQKTYYGQTFIWGK